MPSRRRRPAYDINLLINNAGTSEFAWFADQSEASIERILDVNALAPMLLTQRLLPLLQRRASATIVNVGSIFGYLGYPGCASYSASKFALRGFTEALRRELADGPVRVLYFAPRATRTALNDDALTALNAELGTAMDAPERVADELVALLRRPARERLLGMPEKFFARVNQVLPGLVDNGLRKQLDTIRNFARRGKPRPAPTPPHPSNLQKEAPCDRSKPLAMLMCSLTALVVLFAPLANAAVDDEVRALQREWEEIKYRKPVADQEKAFETLSKTADRGAREVRRPRRSGHLVRDHRVELRRRQGRPRRAVAREGRQGRRSSTRSRSTRRRSPARPTRASARCTTRCPAGRSASATTRRRARCSRRR